MEDGGAEAFLGAGLADVEMVVDLEGEGEVADVVGVVGVADAKLHVKLHARIHAKFYICKRIA